MSPKKPPELLKGIELLQAAIGPSDGAVLPAEAKVVLVEPAELLLVPRPTMVLDWLELPNATLEQVAWLILGCDPHLPPVEGAPSTASPSYKHRDLVNRLQSAVAAGKLRPVSTKHASLALRVNFLKTVIYLEGEDLHPQACAEIRKISKGRKNIPPL